MNIVGIAGLPRSGKDTFAEWYLDAGYYGVSLGDVVREEARHRHKDKPDPISVAHMTETANHLRQQFGSDVILRKAVEQFQAAQTDKSYKGLVLYSIRTPVEADFILKNRGRLVWIEAADAVRYARAIEFAREGERTDIDMETFLAHEALQWQPKPGIPKEAQMDVSYVKSHATDIVENNENDIEGFRQKYLELIAAERS